MNDLVLSGIDGANPLGFLAALGTALTARTFSTDLWLFWRLEQGAWRPVLRGGEGDRGRFVELLDRALRATSSTPFEVDPKLPFAVEKFAVALRRIHVDTSRENRRVADLMTAFGSEVRHEKGVFLDTSFRMVRSGDSAGQGLPTYALAIRKAVTPDALRRTLFEPWEYSDEGFSLRWDPSEDQRYALRWHDPSTNRDKHAPKTMLGANALALEGLVLFPAVPTARGLETTGFTRFGRREFFTWPIWEHPLSLDVVRSLLSLPVIHEKQPDRKKLVAQGITELFRCDRVTPNQYYRNFSPAAPA